jgi:hypothetical protein
MTNNLRYHERVVSNRTEALFLALTLLFLWLLVRRLKAGKHDWLARVFFSLFSLFLFYAVNYRTLRIRLSDEALTLTFGLFTWRVPRENIASARLDELPLLMRFGGAGIHFMWIRKRYRASFNVLEYPRIVVSFKRSVGPVQEISFSTRRPDELLASLRAKLAPPEGAA